MKIITTSWDDGHELDFKLAELLDKYNLKGTFYIPQTNSEQPVMPEEQVKQLSKLFEIGGHTLHHTRLNIADKNIIINEVQGCYTWLSNLIGKSPVSFAFPGGQFNKIAVNEVFNAGFAVARTTELLSTKTSDSVNNTMPTTLQLYAHNGGTYCRHLIKRKRIKSLLTWLMNGSVTGILKLSQKYIKDIQEKGGCFHLWGHSWEIEQYNLWKKTEEVFRLISNIKEFQYPANGDIRSTL